MKSTYQKLLVAYGKGEVSVQEVADYDRAHTRPIKAHNDIDELPLQETSWVYVSLAHVNNEISIDQYAALRQELIVKDGLGDAG